MNESIQNQTNTEVQTPVVDNEEADILAEAMEIINNENKTPVEPATEKPVDLPAGEPLTEKPVPMPVYEENSVTHPVPLPEPSIETPSTFKIPELDVNGKIKLSKAEPEKKVEPISQTPSNDFELKSLKAQNEYLKKGYTFDDETWNDVSKLVDNDFNNAAKVEKYLNILAKGPAEREPATIAQTPRVIFQPRTTEYSKQDSGKFKLSVGYGK